MMNNIGYGQDWLKDIATKEGREEEKKTTEQKDQTKDEANPLPQEHERALKGAYRSFEIPGIQNLFTSIKYI